MNTTLTGFQLIKIDKTLSGVPVTDLSIYEEVSKALASCKNIILFLNGKNYLVSQKQISAYTYSSKKHISIDLGFDVQTVDEQNKLVELTLIVREDGRSYISTTDTEIGGGGSGVERYNFEPAAKGIWDGSDKCWELTLTEAEAKAIFEKAYTDVCYISAILKLAAGDEDNMLFATVMSGDKALGTVTSYGGVTEPYVAQGEYLVNAHIVFTWNEGYTEVTGGTITFTPYTLTPLS